MGGDELIQLDEAIEDAKASLHGWLVVPIVLGIYRIAHTLLSWVRPANQPRQRCATTSDGENGERDENKDIGNNDAE